MRAEREQREGERAAWFTSARGRSGAPQRCRGAAGNEHLKMEISNSKSGPGVTGERPQGEGGVVVFSLVPLPNTNPKFQELFLTPLNPPRKGGASRTGNLFQIGGQKGPLK